MDFHVLIDQGRLLRVGAEFCCIEQFNSFSATKGTVPTAKRFAYAQCPALPKDLESAAVANVALCRSGAIMVGPVCGHMFGKRT